MIQHLEVPGSALISLQFYPSFLPGKIPAACYIIINMKKPASQQMEEDIHLPARGIKALFLHYVLVFSILSLILLTSACPAETNPATIQTPNLYPYLKRNLDRDIDFNLVHSKVS